MTNADRPTPRYTATHIGSTSPPLTKPPWRLRYAHTVSAPALTRNVAPSTSQGRRVRADTRVITAKATVTATTSNAGYSHVTVERNGALVDPPLPSATTHARYTSAAPTTTT